MKYIDFENIMTPARMSRYLTACNHKSRKALTLYRKNLQLSQEMFTIISCFEVALRNSIDKICISQLGNDWLKNGVAAEGIFDNGNCYQTRKAISDAINKLSAYNHSKLVAELGFGFWRFMFAQHQFNTTGRILLRVFPSKPVSTAAQQYNNTYIFNQMASLNEIRNRIAHHEPICFLPGQPVKSTNFTRVRYALIVELFRWMQIDESSLLYGLDHIIPVCDEIDAL